MATGTISQYTSLEEEQKANEKHFPVFADDLAPYWDNFNNFIDSVFGTGSRSKEDKEEIEILKDIWMFAGNPAINIKGQDFREDEVTGRASYFYIPQTNTHAMDLYTNSYKGLKDQFIAEVSHAVQVSQSSEEDREWLADAANIQQNTAKLRGIANEILIEMGFDVEELDDEWRYKIHGTHEHEAHHGIEEAFEGGVEGKLQTYIDQFVGEDRDYLKEKFDTPHGEFYDSPRNPIGLKTIFDSIDFIPSYYDVAKSLFNILTTPVSTVEDQSSNTRTISRGGFTGKFGPEWTDEEIDEYFNLKISGEF